MKKKIYVFPDSPSETEVRRVLESLKPPFNARIGDQVITSFGQIQARLRDAAINQASFHAHHTQSLSDGKHTVTLIGRLDPLTGFEKLMGIFT